MSRFIDANRGTIINSQKIFNNVGTDVLGAMTWKEAAEKADLLFEVGKTGFERIEGQDGVIIESPFKDKFITYRTDTKKELGIVGKGYEVIQNSEAFGFFDSVIDAGEAIFETAGKLGDGERIFALAKLPDDILVAGEPCNKYIILTNSHDGSSSLIAGFTPIRVICWNILQAALSGLSNKISIPHFSGAKAKIAEAYKVMNLSSIYMTEVEGIFNQMAKTPISDTALKAFITETMRPAKVPTDEEGKDLFSKALTNRVDAIYELALSHPTQTTKASRGTLWGAYNTIPCYFNYEKPSYKNIEDKFNQQMFGLDGRRINRAFQLAHTLMLSS